MMEGTYYKEWSAVLDREMEFKVYGHGGVPVLALPARGGRFYDWENNGMPDAAARLLHEGKIQLFCADSIDGESLLAGNESPRRRAEMQEKYFVYLTSELAARIAELNAPESKEKPLIWCVGVDTGAYQAVQCRLRRPRTFAGAMGLSGLYDMGRFLGSAEDDLVLRSSPLAALHKNGICDKNVLSKAEENSLLLCVGQGGYEGDALADTQALADTLSEVGFPCHLEVWGGDVSTGTGGARSSGCLPSVCSAERKEDAVCLNSSSAHAATILAVAAWRNCSAPSGTQGSAAPSWPTPRPWRASRAMQT